MEVTTPAKKQVSEKVMENLRKAQARKKELDEQRKLMSSAKKAEDKKVKTIEKLKQKLVSLTTSGYQTDPSDSEPEVVHKKEPVKMEEPKEVETRPKQVREKPVRVPREQEKKLVFY